MVKIKYVEGDVTDPIALVSDDCILVSTLIMHIVNDQGMMGSGVAKALYKKWPKVRSEYIRWFNEPNTFDVDTAFRLGKTQFVVVSPPLLYDIVVANMVGQHMVGADEHGNPPIRYDALDNCLNLVKNYAERFEFAVHMPYKMGADRARGDWNKIVQMVEDILCKNDIPVVVYKLKG